MLKSRKFIHALILSALLIFCISGAANVYAAPATVNVMLTKNERRTISYKVGQKIQLSRYGLNIRRATYTSSKQDVATVSPTGLIRLKKPGKTIITVKARGMTCKYKLRVTKNKTICDLANKYGKKKKYFIYLNRGKRTVYILKNVFGEYMPYKTFPCCVGAPSTPTPSGVYSIKGKGLYFVTEAGNKCWYFSQIIGHYMFHSQIYSSASTPSTIVDGSMGVACSHGCVRLYIKDAQWINKKMPYGTVVYIE